MKTTNENLEKFMSEAAERVKDWPDWKRDIGIMDRYRQYERYEPKPEQVGKAESAETTEAAND